VWFSRDADQRALPRETAATEKPGDAVFLALLVAGCVMPLRKWRARASGCG